MGTHGVGTFQIDSKFSSGNLVFYEKTVGLTTTGNVFTIGTGAVKIGDTANDIDFQWYGTSSRSFVIDQGAATATSAGLAWSITGTFAVTGDLTLTGDVGLSGDLTLSTEDVSVAQGRMIYLDGQNGGEYLTSDTANDAMLNATTNINLAIGGTDEVNVTSTAVTLATNNLTLTAGRIGVAERYAIYLDGQGGGEYIVSDLNNEATINATTTLNLAIGGTDEVAISSTAVTLPTNNLTLTAGRIAVTERYSIYLNGQGGAEYVVSDAANDLMLNATTNLNLAIGGTDEVSVTSSAVTLATNNLTLSAGNASVVQGKTIYLSGQGGGEYIVSSVANDLDLNATTNLYLRIGGTVETELSNSVFVLRTNDLRLDAGDISVIQGAYIYLDGQSGGEYLVSDSANEATLNATTTLNLSISGSDKISMVAATTTVNNDLAITAGEFITGAPIKMLITEKSANTKYLTVAESGLIEATADRIYLYLPTYIGNTGLTYFIKQTATFGAGIGIYAYDATEYIDGANTWLNSTRYDLLGVIADTQGWHVINKIGTWA